MIRYLMLSNWNWKAGAIHMLSNCVVWILKRWHEAKKGQGPTIINLIGDFYPLNAHSRAHVSRFAIFFVSVPTAQLGPRSAWVESDKLLLKSLEISKFIMILDLWWFSYIECVFSCAHILIEKLFCSNYLIQKVQTNKFNFPN